LECAMADSLEIFVEDDALEGGAFEESRLYDIFEDLGESDTLEGVATRECVFANSLEVFVEDDALEGGAFVERPRFDVFEHIGESDTREGGAVLECFLADSFEVFVEDDALEGGTAIERSSMILSSSGRVILLMAKHCSNAPSPKIIMLLCSPNTTLARW